jgi:cell wall-associated NlpC family hydrolase
LTDAAKRAEIVAEAMTWLNTPYHHNSSIKKVGVDCARLPAAIYYAVGLIPLVEPEYSPQWMLHHDQEKFLEFVLPYAREITRADLLPGDLIMWKFGRTYSHSGIVIDDDGHIIHAVTRNQAVVLGDFERDTDLTSRPSRFFSLFGSN